MVPRVAHIFVDSVEMKRCPGCESVLALAAFGIDKARYDRLTLYCLECVRGRTRRYNASARGQKVREAYNSNEIHKSRKRNLASQKRLEGAVDYQRERRRARELRERYPEHQAARMLLRRALARGDLSRSTTCQRCGVEDPRDIRGRPLIHAHHKDYSRPLDVEWLCALCHAEEHGKAIRTRSKQMEEGR